MSAPSSQKPAAAPSRSSGIQPARARRRNQSALSPFLLIRGFLVIVLAVAFSTLERSEMWPDKSRLVATFKIPAVFTTKIKAGDRLPSIELALPAAAGPTPDAFVTTDRLFQGKRALLLSAPIAFSPTCSDEHIPGFLKAQDKLKAKGIDIIAVVSMDTPFAMRAWSKQLDADGMLFLSDPLGQLAKALGTTFHAGPFGLRSSRYSMVLEDMTITKWAVEKGGELQSSAAETFLADL